MIGIVDYGSGNVFSLMSALNALGHDAKLVTTVAEIRNASKIILPGVGAFPSAIERLREKTWTKQSKKQLKTELLLVYASECRSCFLSVKSLQKLKGWMLSQEK